MVLPWCYRRKNVSGATLHSNNRIVFIHCTYNCNVDPISTWTSEQQELRNSALSDVAPALFKRLKELVRGVCNPNLLELTEPLYRHKVCYKITNLVGLEQGCLLANDGTSGRSRLWLRPRSKSGSRNDYKRKTVFD